jgi:hypothetical protein
MRSLSGAPETFGDPPRADQRHARHQIHSANKGERCLTAFVAAFIIFFAFDLLNAAEPGKASPAKVANPGKEADLATLTLTPEAEQRLGITTAVVERRKFERTRMFGGEIILPPRFNTNAAAASAGGSGQSIFSILPSLTPTELIRIAEAQIDADGQVDRAKVQLDAAQVILERAEKLLRDKAGSVRALDDAKVQAGLAEAALRAARARRELFGAPVLDVMNQKQFWVRVPVYVGDVPRLKTAAEARVGGLADAAGLPTRPAKPVVAPPSANPGAATVDLFYEVGNEDGALRLGQKVGVTLAMQEPDESLIVPWSAVVHDIQGGAWVYENTGPQAFTRRRVQVRSVAGAEAVLERGPKPGAKVVTNGVAELFGTEFGVGK